MESMKTELWQIATSAQMARKIIDDIEQRVNALSEISDVFCASDMYFDMAQIVSASYDDQFVFTEDGTPIAKNKRETIRRSVFGEDDNEKILEILDYFVNQRQGWPEDSYTGTIYFVLEEDPKKKHLMLFAVGFDT